MATIRTLQPGEQIPSSQPKRYKSSHGYIRLRWWVATSQYVETYEHRVFNGFVTTAQEVHHLDHDKANNALENLVPTGQAEHQKHHRRLDYKKIIRLYAQGFSTPEIGRLLQCNPAAVYRILVKQGVTPRSLSESLRTQFDDDQIQRLHAAGVRSRRLADALGFGATAISNAFKRLGLSPHRTGSPTREERIRADTALREEGLHD